MSTFGLAFISAESEAQQGLYSMLHTCLRSGDDEEGRRWVRAFCSSATGR